MLDPANDEDLQATNRSLLLSYIAANDVACPVCGYNLRRLTVDVCPECGQRFQLRVGSDSVRFGYFLVFLAPLIMLAGLSGFFVILGLTLRDWPRWPRDWGFYAIMVAGVVSGVAIAPLYRARQRAYFRKSRNFQVIVTGVCWVVVILIVVLCMKFGSR